MLTENWPAARKKTGHNQKGPKVYRDSIAVKPQKHYLVHTEKNQLHFRIMRKKTLECNKSIIWILLYNGVNELQKFQTELLVWNQLRTG